ncbi:hypothetical protein GGS24DRAFT_487168 [Hypoxylon argillaceum]|nr:hypothetical protein GGS24DRAFT_487168 [Hypoxylon argillaceum]
MAQLSEGNAKITIPAQYNNLDSAVDMTFPANVKNDLAKFEDSEKETKMGSLNTNNPFIDPMAKASHPSDAAASGMGNPSAMPFVLVEGMPFAFSRIMEMGQALAKARRERMFPTTITPHYNVKAVIDDFEALERLNLAREGANDTRDDAFRPEVSRLYIEIQRKIQDRDLTYGEVAADANVRARLSGFANSTGAETSMYNLMRHAMNSVLRLNNLTVESGSNIVDAVAARVIGEIRNDVQSRVARGEHNVEGVDMNGVMEDVFNAIENSLAQGVGAQANRLDGQINNMSSITHAQNIQLDAIASHVNAIDNHAHAMGNNVNAMGSLLNSTNGNVTSLSTNIGTLQTIVNMLPQMVSNAIREMLPGIIGPAVEQALEAAITNELMTRMQAFAHAVQAAQAEVINNPRSKRRSWFSIFKRRSTRHGSRTGPTY